MFQDSGIVDCGIGNWNVDGAQTHEMLLGATKFRGRLANWPERAIRAARGFRGGPVPGAGFGAADTEARISAVFATALRKREKGASSQEQCAIL
jgi:hypothetical protein